VAKIKFQDLRKIRRRHKNDKIVFCSGGFDLTHAGHVLFLEDCKKFGNILVVGVGPDKIMKKEKGEERPVLNEYLRLKMVDSLKPVDYVFIITPMPERHHLDPVYRAIENLKPDTYVVNEDASYLTHRKHTVKKIGSRLIVLHRTCPPEFKNVSTTNIIKKIKGTN
jgi:rfaE bifunctional protein nucleotidyltransferase chain/domain